jgi:hypothetical protein
VQRIERLAARFGYATPPHHISGLRVQGQHQPLIRFVRRQEHSFTRDDG